MRSRKSCVLVFLLAVVASSLVALPTAWACSVCGCDPAASTLGIERPSTRSLRLGLEDRLLSKESGDGAAAESERENRLLVRAQYAPLTPFVLQIEAPVFLWKSHLDAAGVQDDNAHGLGDVILSARTELARIGGLVPRHVFALTAALKLPTGANSRHLPGEDPDEHLQLGTGSWDGLGGLSYVYGDAPWAIYSSVIGRLNGANGRDFRYGHALFATLGARRAFLDDRVQLSLESQWRSAGKDRFADGSFDPDSGGQILYATAGAAVAVRQDLVLRAQLQVPTWRALNGVQSEHPVAYLGLAYDWALP